VRPEDLIASCVAAHRRLLSAVDRLTDDKVLEPSLLPGWSRGHVITHLARNADSHVWLFDGAIAGEVRSQYPSLDKRSEDIEAGARRSAQALGHDLKTACARLESAWRDLNEDLWDREGVVVAGKRTMDELIFRRLREVEVHHVDLDVGYAPSDWPSAYIDGELRRRLPGLQDRADRRALVTWLLGRGEAPVLGPW
jgi:maleylpyruvate isomerase